MEMRQWTRSPWIAVGLVLLQVSCGRTPAMVAEDDDALAALGAPVVSMRYDGAFWAREAHRGSLLWKQAKALCRERAPEVLPTCHTVELVARWEAPVSLPALVPPPTPPALRPTNQTGSGPGVERRRSPVDVSRLRERPGTAGATR